MEGALGRPASDALTRKPNESRMLKRKHSGISVQPGLLFMLLMLGTEARPQAKSGPVIGMVLLPIILGSP